MTLRPVEARWFEVLTDREHLGAVLRGLAATHAVELEAKSAVAGVAALPDYRAVLSEFGELTRRYAPFWPAPAVDPAAPPPESLAGARDALGALRRWAAAADPVIERHEGLAREDAALAESATVLEAAGVQLPDLAALTAAGPALAPRLYALDPAAVVELPAAVLAQAIACDGTRYLLCLGGLEDMREADRLMVAARARAVTLPGHLPAGRGAALAAIAARRAPLAAERAQLESGLAELAQRHRLAGLLGSFRFLEWLVSHVPQLPATEHFAYVTGWTRDLQGRRLAKALAASGLPHLLHFPEAPRTLEAPIVLANPRFLQPFEAFVRVLGTPAAGEADPTPVVAVIAPLLFGYMFGDVGQGLVLLALGLALRRRRPALALLVSGGAAATVFGFAFGSVFAREDLLPVLWRRPLEMPLATLATSVVFGIVVLCGGFALDALQSAWIGRGRDWLLSRGGLVVLYLGLVTAPFTRSGVIAALGGVVWYLAGSALVAGSIAAVGRAAGELLETLLQLLVNTISFARVGAFALAHAGLSAAVVGIAAASGGRAGYYVALVLGNLLMLALEGLVVGIQTARLVLFEFFIRFLKAEGRPFRALPEPDQATFKESP
jgi:V/A-type H+/Na+-transporting ATPase subunit I